MKGNPRFKYWHKYLDCEDLFALYESDETSAALKEDLKFYYDEVMCADRGNNKALFRYDTFRNNQRRAFQTIPCVSNQ